MGCWLGEGMRNGGGNSCRVVEDNSALLLLCFLFSCFVLCRQINKGTKRGLVFSDKFLSFSFLFFKGGGKQGLSMSLLRNGLVTLGSQIGVEYEVEF